VPHTGGRVGTLLFSSAGPIDLPAGTVSPINIVEWQRFPIVGRVSALAGAPVRLGGDGLQAMVRGLRDETAPGLLNALVERAEELNGGPMLDDVAAFLVQRT